MGVHHERPTLGGRCDISDLPREFDIASRHVHVAHAVEHLAPPGPVLDVGGSEGLTRGYLPDRRVVAVDVRDLGVDVIGSGAALPFPDRAFAAATALDVLEHIARDLRPKVLAEMTRVADIVVIAGPFEAPEVVAAEREQRDLYAVLFGSDHPWLREHAECGLPDLGELARSVESLGLHCRVFGSNPIGVWSATMVNNFMTLKFGADETVGELRRWLETPFLAGGDGTPPSYRRIVVVGRSADLVEKAESIAPASEPQMVDEALRRSRLSTTSVVSGGWQRLMDRYEEAVRTAVTASEAVASLEEGQRQLQWQQAEIAELVSTSGAWRSFVSGPAVTADAQTDCFPSPEEYGAWLRARERLPAPEEGPVVSVITPVFNTAAEHLVDCIRSVRRQTYARWELILVDASDAPHVRPICERFCALDRRIIRVETANQGIARNTMVGASRSRGSWLVFLDHDDVIEPHALASVVSAAAKSPDTDFLYSDEDKLDTSGRYLQPFLKPDWSPDLLRCVNYLAHLVAVRRDLFDRVGGIRPGLEGAQDYDFVLRATAAAGRVGHIPDVLYHWRQHEKSTAADVSVKRGVHEAGARALRELLSSEAPGSWVAPGPGLSSHRVRYRIQARKVSVVIPFRDRSDLTDRCLESFARHGTELPIEVLLVSNRSSRPETFDAMDRWQQAWSWARVLEFDEPYNYQRLNNWAAARASGDDLLFLNNDVEILHHGWLEALAEFGQREKVGAVGARLFYPNGLVQHAGVAVGIGGFADHPWARLHPDAATPAGPSYWVRNTLAVTGACMFLAHGKFDEVGGFDERFLVCGGDVDLGIRLHQRGYWNVMTPFARLVHHEGMTRDMQPPDNDVEQSLIVYRRYLTEGDPYLNPNLTRVDTSCAIGTLEARSLRGA